MGLSQLKRLDNNISKRNENFKYFLDRINENYYFKEFKLEGSSNYAFNLILKDKDQKLMNKLCSNLDKYGIEFRQGSAGGGNQLRQNKIFKMKNLKIIKHRTYTFFGMYLAIILN